MNYRLKFYNEFLPQSKLKIRQSRRDRDLRIWSCLIVWSLLYTTYAFEESQESRWTSRKLLKLLALYHVVILGWRFFRRGGRRISILRTEWSLDRCTYIEFFDPACFKVVSLFKGPDHFLINIRSISKTASCPAARSRPTSLRRSRSWLAATDWTLRS